MEMNSSGGASGWLYDYSFDISVAGADFMAADSAGFSWGPQSQTFKGPSNMRLRTESCASGSKAGREKLRRDKLNERFLELSSILEPGRLPKTDKVAILSDAARVVIQLRNEAERVKEMNDELQAKVKELKAEKNELRDEKNRLKEEKEKLEQQVKLTNVHPSILPQTATAKGQVGGHKLIPFIGYPGYAMWQFMPPAALDTSKDHLLRPPVA
ncbi:transcription factor bHLH115 isoform X2 [Cajanus cajan]|uniref:transcription factor bHLH115 isoform X2 n=1 Tax=Cajanus cajan TaxID=3821 RepID=UPI00098DB9E5|nr:transcription factor bHLH115 isoform X2 [Cajanus cajan]